GVDVHAADRAEAGLMAEEARRGLLEAERAAAEAREQEEGRVLLHERPPPEATSPACGGRRTAPSSSSIKTARRPSAAATCPTVPVPANGSSTRSPGAEPARMQRRASAGGMGAAWTPSPLEVGSVQTVRAFRPRGLSCQWLTVQFGFETF